MIDKLIFTFVFSTFIGSVSWAQSKPSGSTDHNKKLVRDFIDTIWHDRNVEMISTFWSENYVNHAVPTDPQTGMDNLKRSHQMFLNAFSGLRLEVLDQVAEGDKVVSRLRFSGSHTGEFMHLPATNRSIQMTGIRIDRIENGKIVEHWADYDLAGLMRQLTQ